MNEWINMPITFPLSLSQSIHQHHIKLIRRSSSQMSKRGRTECRASTIRSIFSSETRIGAESRMAAAVFPFLFFLSLLFRSIPIYSCPSQLIHAYMLELLISERENCYKMKYTRNLADFQHSQPNCKFCY